MNRIFSRFSRTVALTAFLALTAGFALAQAGMQQQSMKGAVVKGKAPVNKEVLKVTLPKPSETRLSNGIQVIVLENHKLPTFSMQMVILSGGLADPADQRGAAQFTASLLREGTKTRNSRQLAEEVDKLGASLFANSGLASLTTSVSASGLTENFDDVMELFSDVVLNPSFPEDEFNKYRTRQLAQLNLQRSQPFFLAGERFSKAMYGDHPASKISLTADEMKRLTPESLRRFHATHFKPNNAIFAIVGDVKLPDVVARLEKAFGSWQQGDVPNVDILKAGDTGPSKIHLIDRPGSVQTNLILGTLSIERTDPDYPALEVMNRVVGGGPSGRLFMNLREDKGYTYGAYSGFSAYKYRGTFQANTEVRTDVTGGSMKELMYELKRIRDEKVTESELDNAKRAIVGGFALQLEFPQSVLQNTIVQKLYGLPADYWDSYPQKISAVTQDDAQRVARKYIDLSKLQVIAVGDAKIIAETMKQYGLVEMYDTEGRLIKSPPPSADGASIGGGGAAGLAVLAGLWNITANTPDGQIPLKLEIKPNGAEIGGMLDTPFGQFPVVGGSIEGTDVTIKIKADVQGNQTDVLVKGKLDGDTMKGQITASAFPTVDFTAKREK